MIKSFYGNRGTCQGSTSVCELVCECASVWMPHKWFRHVYYALHSPLLRPHLSVFFTLLPGRRWLPWLQGRYGYQGRQGKHVSVTSWVLETSFKLIQLIRHLECLHSKLFLGINVVEGWPLPKQSESANHCGHVSPLWPKPLWLLWNCG